MRVDRCVCFGQTFAELLALARREGLGTVEELQGRVEFGRSCRLCKPYVRRALATGEVVFTELLLDDG